MANSNEMSDFNVFFPNEISQVVASISLPEPIVERLKTGVVFQVVGLFNGSYDAVEGFKRGEMVGIKIVKNPDTSTPIFSE